MFTQVRNATRAAAALSAELKTNKELDSRVRHVDLLNGRALEPGERLRDHRKDVSIFVNNDGTRKRTAFRIITSTLRCLVDVVYVDAGLSG